MNIRVIAAGLAVSGLLGICSLKAQMTEGPTTVAKGGWLLEMDALGGAWDWRTGDPDYSKITTTWGGAVMFTTGVADKLDLQIGWDGWSREAVYAPDSHESSNSSGDLWFRGKWNFYGDEETGSAWAILPYVRVPTGSGHEAGRHLDPGVVLIYGRPLGESFWTEAMAVIDSITDTDGGRFTAYWFSAVVGHDCGGYAELALVTDDLPAAETAMYFGSGYAWDIPVGWTVDVECMAGLNRAAEDLILVLRFTIPWGGQE